MKDKIFGVLQRVGRSFMLPIAILPVAGLLLGLGSSFTNETMLKAYGLLGIMGPGTVFNAIFQVMSDAGNIVFTNLPIIFAMGVAIGMAKKEKEVAALAAAFYGYPSEKVVCIGITGSKGKTTCTHMMADILRAAGYLTGTIGTNGAIMPAGCDHAVWGSDKYS